MMLYVTTDLKILNKVAVCAKWKVWVTFFLLLKAISCLGRTMTVPAEMLQDRSRQYDCDSPTSGNVLFLKRDKNDVGHRWKVLVKFLMMKYNKFVHRNLHLHSTGSNLFHYLVFFLTITILYMYVYKTCLYDPEYIWIPLVLSNTYWPGYRIVTNIFVGSQYVLAKRISKM